MMCREISIGIIDCSLFALQKAQKVKKEIDNVQIYIDRGNDRRILELFVLTLDGPLDVHNQRKSGNENSKEGDEMLQCWDKNTSK